MKLIESLGYHTGVYAPLMHVLKAIGDIPLITTKRVKPWHSHIAQIECVLHLESTPNPAGFE